MDYDELQARRAARAQAEQEEARAQRESDVQRELNDIRRDKGLAPFVSGAKQLATRIAGAFNRSYGSGN